MKGIVVNRFAHVCKTGLAAFILMAAVVACGSDDASRDRNSLGVQGTACVKPGQVTKVSKQSVVCAKTNIGPLWYATMKAKGKTQACKSPGVIRKKSNIVWACGVVNKKKLWQATQPLPAAVLASTTGIEPGASQSTPALDSTQVQAVADNVVLADPKIPDDKTVTQVQVIEEATTPPSTVSKTAITSPTMATPTTYFSATTAVPKSTIPSQTTAYTPTTIGTIVNSTAYAPKTTIASPTTVTIPSPRITISTTVTTTVINTISATCAKGGTCKVGDVGPGGGKVFYVATSAFTSTGSACNTACKYLEAAPSDHSSTVAWCSNTSSSLGVTAQGIGSGMSNTTTADSTCTSGAIQVAADYTNNSKTDWHLPSKDELAQLYAERTKVGSFAYDYYWSSSEPYSYASYGQRFGDGAQNLYMKSRISGSVRLVRAF
jgi:hypothetical protein